LQHLAQLFLNSFSPFTRPGVKDRLTFKYYDKGTRLIDEFQHQPKPVVPQRTTPAVDTIENAPRNDLTISKYLKPFLAESISGEGI